MNLCAISTCRMRGRHLPACAGDCKGCLPRVATEGIICDAHVSWAESDLAGIAELLPDARAVAAGLVQRGHGMASGKPGSRPPLNVDAQDALDAVTNALTTIAREIADERGLQIAVDASMHPDPLARVCEWLTRQLGWLRHAVDEMGHPRAEAVFTEIRDSVRRIRGIVDGPAPAKYLGPCGRVRQCEGLLPDDWPEADCGNHAPHEAHQTDPCKGNVYGQPGAESGRCRTCKAEHKASDREAWLAEQVKGSILVARASVLADSLGLSIKTIYWWATPRISESGHLLAEAKLATYWRTEAGRIVPWTDPLPGEDVRARGHRLHYVADVKELAEKAAERRERRQAAEMGA